jgi:MYXO-CTERM domain-containing protein
MVDSCQSGACVGSNPVRCDAPDACHIPNGCDPDTGSCLYKAADDGTSCDDSNPCTLNDTCASGSCAGTPNTCEPSDGCHAAGACDQVTGECVNPVLADGTSCSDGTCKAGVCESSGCGCSSGAGAASWALFIVPALALVRRRRS